MKTAAKQGHRVRQASYAQTVIHSLLRVRLWVLLVLVFGGVFYTRAGVPTRVYAATSSNLNFQARLSSSSGTVVPDGNYSIEFKIYSVLSGGVAEWSETQPSVRVVNGYMTVQLGSVASFPGTIDWSQEHWLTMNVNGDGEMNPRLKLTAVPYAFRSGQADTLTNGSSSLTANNLAQLGPSSPQIVNLALAAIRINQTGTGALLQLQGDGGDVFTLDKLGNGYFKGSLTTDGPLVITSGGATITGDITTSGALVLGTTANAAAGTIRWTGLDFQGFDGTEWKSLTSGGGGGGTSIISGGGGLTSVKTANQTITNNTVLQSVTDLYIPIAANESRTFRFVVQAVSTAQANLQFAVMAPTGATCKVGAPGTIGNLGCGVNFTISSVGTDQVYEITGTVTNSTTAGNIQLEWAQATNRNNHSATIYAGSYVYSTSTSPDAGATDTFLQGGNAFGAPAVAGTTDNQAFNLITNGSTVLNLATSGLATFNGAVTTAGSLTVNNGGASITGGIDNNSGGITNAGNITGVGTNITAADALTIASTGTGNLTLNSGSGLAVLGAVTLRTSDSLALDLSKATNTLLTLQNSGTGIANLNLGDGNLQTAGTIRLTNGGVLQNITGLTVTSGGADITGNILLGGSSSDRLSISAQLSGSNPLEFQGATDNGFTTVLAVADPTANNIITLPNSSGTLVLDSRNIQTASGSGLTGGGNLGADLNLSLDIFGLTTKNTVNMNDYVAIYDSATSSVKKISRADLLQGVIGALQYRGTWDAATNTPALSDATGVNGDMYAVSVAATRNLGSGNISFGAGDFVIHNGTVWEVAPSAADVDSVFGRTGLITAQSGDYSALQITSTPSGTLSSTNVQAALNELDTSKLGSLNGLTASSQTFANDTNIAINSSGSTHTLSWNGQLSVGRGGTGVSSFTVNGLLYGNGTGSLQVTSAGTGGQVLIADENGVPSFVSLSGDATINATGIVTIGANSVVLGTDTVGSYVANLGTLTGLTATGNTGEGSTPTLSVIYGSTSNSAVQGSTVLICPSGTGNLTGGGNSITLGAGGTCGGFTTVNNPTFSTSVNTPILTSNSGLSITSGGTGNISLDSASNKLVIAASDTTLQRSAAGTYTIDLSDADTTSLTLTNTDTGIADLNIAEGGLQTNSMIRLDNAGNLLNIGSISAAGDIITGGSIVEKSVTFTPTAVGWYRIATGINMMGGTIRISAPLYDNTLTDLELQYNISGYGVGGSIQQTRYSSYNNGVISAARISSDGVATVYLDIFVSSATAPQPITIHGFGPNQPSFVGSPVVGASAGSTDVNMLTLGHGFRSTQGAIFAESGGRVGIGTSSTPSALLSIGGTTGNLTVDASGNLATGGTTRLTATGALQNLTGISTTGGLVFNSFGGSAGLLKVDASGNVSVTTAGTDYEVPLTFSNGLTRTGNTIKLGGALTGLTNIDLSGNDLVFGGAGNVGVGTASPSVKLDVSGNLRLYDQTAVTGTTTLSIRAGAGQSTTKLIDIRNNANVSLVTVESTGLITSSWADVLGMSHASYSRIYALNHMYFDTVNSGAGIHFRPGGTELLNLTSSGTVGIGTTGAPSALLSIGGTTGNLTIDSSGNLSTGGTTRLGANGTLQNITGLTIISGGASITGDTSVSSGAFTASGGVISLNANSNFATNINTGSSTGTVTIGGGSTPLVIDTTNFDFDSTNGLSIIGNAQFSNRVYVPGISGSSGQGYFIGTPATQLSGYQSLDLGGYTYSILATNKSYNVETGWVDSGLGRLGSSFQMINDSFTFYSFDTGTNFNPRFTVASGGNVGIGTSGAPGGLLSIGGSTGNFTVDSFGNVSTLGTTRLTAAGALQNVAGNNTNGVSFDANTITSGLLPVLRGGTGAGSFTTNGVIFGNNTGTLQVTAAGSGGQVLIANGSGVPTFTSLSGDVTIGSSGLTAIGSDAVALGADTTGNYIADITIQTGGGLVVSGTGSETATASLTVRRDCSSNQIIKWSTSGSGSWNCANDNSGLSDSRVKQNVTTINTNILDKIKSVRLVEFDFDCNSPAFSNLHCNMDHQAGVIAQELAELFPQLVFTDAKGYLNVRYDMLGVYNMRALSQLAAIISANGNAKLNDVNTGGVLRLSQAGLLDNINGLRIVNGGASIAGGLNNNGGGITNAGAILGATTIAAESLSLNANLADNLLTLRKDNTGVFTIFNNGALEMRVTSDNAFALKDASGKDYFNVNTNGGLVRIGSTVSDEMAVLFVLDSKSTAGDPQGVNGAQYYNEATHKFRCFQNNQWQDCLPASNSEYVLVAQPQNWNQPPADTEFLGQPRTWVDLTNAREFRLTTRLTAEGSVVADCRLQYAISDNGPWKNLDGQAGPELSLAETGTLKTPWSAIYTEARKEVLIRVMCKEGSNGARPEFYGIKMQVR